MSAVTFAASMSASLAGPCTAEYEAMVIPDDGALGWDELARHAGSEVYDLRVAAIAASGSALRRYTSSQLVACRE